MFFIFALGKSNILPKKDLGLLKAISLTYKIKLPIKDKDLEKLFKKWSPYNTIATWYLMEIIRSYSSYLLILAPC